MSIRFRRSFKVAPGLKLNLGKGSVGLSAGVKGAHTSINSKGRTTTSVGVPGTGLSYVSTGNIKKKKSAEYDESDQYEEVEAVPRKAPIKAYIIGAVILLIGLFNINGSFLAFFILSLLGLLIIIMARIVTKPDTE